MGARVVWDHEVAGSIPVTPTKEIGYYLSLFCYAKYNLGDDYLNNIKAAIFDLDGTLVDSMWVWKQIDIDYLSSKGHDVPNNLNDEITHLSFSQTAEYFKKRFSIEDSIEDIMNTWDTMAYNHYKNNVKLKPNALNYLKKLKNSGIKLGLATSSSTSLLTATLINNNAFDLFDAITVTDEVKKSKSNPDIYLLAAKKLGVSPSECMVYEDIIAAVEGVKLAGMKVTGVYDEHAKHQIELLKKECDNYIYSYEELL